MTLDPSSPAEADRGSAWIAKVRSLHQRKRAAGFVGCAVGVTLMLWGKFRPEAPSWAIPVGLAIAIAAWLVFVYIIVDRWRWVKAHPFKP